MYAETTLMLVVLTNLRLLGASRLGASIRTAAVQGTLLGALALLAHQGALAWQTWFVALGGMAIKGVVFPWLLFRALREADVDREVTPVIGPVSSLLSGVVMLGVSVWLAGRLTLPDSTRSSPLVAIALFSMLAGLFLIIARKQAVNQVLGFLVMENGIYLFGVGVVQESPLLVELGVLLDVFVAVFVMGIMIFHIHREFDHLDTRELTRLKD